MSLFIDRVQLTSKKFLFVNILCNIMYFSFINGMDDQQENSRSRNSAYTQNTLNSNKRQNRNHQNNYNQRGRRGRGGNRGTNNFAPRGGRYAGNSNVRVVNFSQEVPNCYATANASSPAYIPPSKQKKFMVPQSEPQKPTNFYQSLTEASPEGLMQFLNLSGTPLDPNYAGPITITALKNICLFFMNRSQDFFYTAVSSVKTQMDQDFRSNKIAFLPSDTWQIARYMKEMNDACFDRSSVEMPSDKIDAYLGAFNISGFDVKHAYEALENTDEKADRDFFELFLQRCFFWPLVLPIVKNVLWTNGFASLQNESYKGMLQQNRTYNGLECLLRCTNQMDLMLMALDDPFLRNLAICSDHTKPAHCFYFAAITVYSLFTMSENVNAAICARNGELNISFDFCMKKIIPTIGPNYSDVQLFVEILLGKKMKSFYLLSSAKTAKKFEQSIYVGKKYDPFYLENFYVNPVTGNSITTPLGPLIISSSSNNAAPMPQNENAEEFLLKPLSHPHPSQINLSEATNSNESTQKFELSQCSHLDEITISPTSILSDPNSISKNQCDSLSIETNIETHTLQNSAMPSPNLKTLTTNQIAETINTVQPIVGSNPPNAEVVNQIETHVSAQSSEADTKNKQQTALPTLKNIRFHYTPNSESDILHKSTPSSTDENRTTSIIKENTMAPQPVKTHEDKPVSQSSDQIKTQKFETTKIQSKSTETTQPQFSETHKTSGTSQKDNTPKAQPAPKQTNDKNRETQVEKKTNAAVSIHKQINNLLKEINKLYKNNSQRLREGFRAAVMAFQKRVNSGGDMTALIAEGENLLKQMTDAINNPQNSTKQSPILSLKSPQNGVNEKENTNQLTASKSSPQSKQQRKVNGTSNGQHIDVAAEVDAETAHRFMIVGQASNIKKILDEHNPRSVIRAQQNSQKIIMSRTHPTQAASAARLLDAPTLSFRDLSQTPQYVIFALRRIPVSYALKLETIRVHFDAALEIQLAKQIFELESINKGVNDTVEILQSIIVYLKKLSEFGPSFMHEKDMESFFISHSKILADNPLKDFLLKYQKSLQLQDPFNLSVLMSRTHPFYIFISDIIKMLSEPNFEDFVTTLKSISKHLADMSEVLELAHNMAYGQPKNIFLETSTELGKLPVYLDYSENALKQVGFEIQGGLKNLFLQQAKDASLKGVLVDANKPGQPPIQFSGKTISEFYNTLYSMDSLLTAVSSSDLKFYNYMIDGNLSHISTFHGPVLFLSVMKMMLNPQAEVLPTIKQAKDFFIPFSKNNKNWEFHFNKIINPLGSAIEYLDMFAMMFSVTPVCMLLQDNITFPQKLDCNPRNEVFVKNIHTFKNHFTGELGDPIFEFIFSSCSSPTDTAFFKFIENVIELPNATKLERLVSILKSTYDFLNRMRVLVENAQKVADSSGI